MSGWYSVKRGMLDHDLFRPEGKWSKTEAWLWLIENAAFKPTVIDIGGKPHTVPRGALCFSERFMADKFGWSQKALQNFLSKLEAHGAIAQTVEKTGNGTKSKRKQITLCNYDKYQSSEVKTASRRNQNGIKEEQGNNIPPSEGASAPEDFSDPAKVIFTSGVKLLRSSGKSDQAARSVLGKWRRDHGDDALIAALGRAQREGAIDPISFIEGCFRFNAKKADPRPGDKRISRDGLDQEYGGYGVGWLTCQN